MNRVYSLLLLTILVSTTAGAAPRRVAAEVEKMHALNVAFYQHDLFANARPIGENLKSELLKGTQAEIIPGKLISLVDAKSGTISISIPFEGTTIVVELVRANIFTNDFSVLTSDNKAQSYTPGVYYKGIIRGNPNSISSFSFFNNQVYGTVSDETHGNIVIAQLKGQSSYVIYAAGDLARPMQNFCHTTENVPGIGGAPKNRQAMSMSSTTKCARLFYEVDFDLYGDNGSDVVTTTNWITAVHNNIQTLYDNDNIDISMSQIFIWTSADPYNGSDSNDQLLTFRSTRITFNGDLAQLVASDGGFGGLGYLDALCTNYNYSYADVDFSFSIVPAFSWTVECMTHEIGHNLGSPHTHFCGWPGGAIDDCYATEGGCPSGPTPPTGGTIMSYCHLSPTGINFLNGFGPMPRDTIISHVNSASCLGSSCTACPTPAHDVCANAAALAISSNCVYVIGNLCGSTQSIAPISCGGFTAANGYDVWYRITPTQASVNINCVSGVATDVVLAIYSGTCGGALALVDCEDASSTGGSETINATLTPGSTYYIRVYDHNANTTGTDFAICVSQNCQGNTNNSCGSSTVLTIGSTCVYTDGDLCSATQSMSPSQCSGYTANDALDLWYSITPAQNNVQVTASSGANTDLILGIYSGTCGGLNLIRCIDTTGAGGTEQFTVSLTVGNTYYVRVYDWEGNQFGTDFRICARYICTTPSAATSATVSTNPICGGDSTTLTANGTLSQFATWKWYASTCGGTSIGSGTTLNVSPVSTTTYYVRAENGNCLSACKNAAVTVIPIPNTPTSANANPTSVCPGSSALLTVSGALSGGAAWFWYKDSCGGTAAGNGATINVTPSITTTYFVRAQNLSCYSPCSTVTVTMDSVPADPVSVTSSTDTICPGDSVTINVTGTLSGAASWEWYRVSCGANSSGTGNSITVSPSSTTTWFVRAENGNCFSNCSTKTIVVESAAGIPTAAGPSTSVCEGDSVVLGVNGTLGTGSDWYWYLDSCGGTVVGQGINLPLITGATSTYYVRAENSNCISTCQSAVITVNASPAPPTINVAGNILSVPIATSYEWYFGLNDTNFTSLANTQQITALTNGYYYVEIGDANGCTANSDTVLFIDPSAVNELQPNTIIVYPNPVNNLLYVNMNDQATGHYTIRLFDATGKEVISENRKGNGFVLINVEPFAEGVYELVINLGDRLFTQKIVKE